MKTISLDLHDGSLLRTRIDLLDKFKEHYPKAKVSLFWIPYDFEAELSQLRLMRKERIEWFKERADWFEFIPHGITHMFGEFIKADKHTMRMYLDSVEEEFAKDGLKVTRGFCAPNWLWTQDVCDVLDEYGWWGAVDRDQPNMIKPKKSYIYTHSIDEPFWLEDDTDHVSLHGHMSSPSANDLESNFANLFTIPPDVGFKFVSEIVE